MGSGSHPVEVVGRIRGHPDGKDDQSSLTVLPNGKSLRVRHDQGYRDFVLDGISMADKENLRGFYTNYVEARVEDVRAGGRCTVLMYGPTGSGKSHTMFGSTREPGVAYLALHQIMMNKLPPKGPLAALDVNLNPGVNVTANVVEIYNEEVYDLLASNCVASPGPKSLRSLPGRARLEVRGRKVRNATSISGDDPAKLVHEISKVEKRRVVKSTASNDRSSRSHCMVVLDVASVGGKLILVDMAGSENSDQAGTGQEAKLQTGKINQGNGALKRVVECIANGDTHIPYRDSKLTMLLQDSFEEDGAKMLMVLCASPDMKDAHKTICTLEYGAKAKCIVRVPKSPPKEGATFAEGMEAVLQARLRFKDECIEKLRQEYEQKQRDSEAKAKELDRQEQELSILRSLSAKLEQQAAEKMKEIQKQTEQVLQEKSEELKRAVELETQMDVPPDNHLRLAELEEMIENQKQEIAVWRLRAEKAEIQLLELQKSSRLSESPPRWAESAEVVDMDISNSLCISKDFSAFLKVGQGQTKQTDTNNTAQTNNTVQTIPNDNSNERTPEGDLGGPERISWNEIGLYKPGWLPIIPEECDESNDPLPRPTDSCEVRTDISRDDGSSEYQSQPLFPSNLVKEFEKFKDSGTEQKVADVMSSPSKDGYQLTMGLKSPVAERKTPTQAIVINSPPKNGFKPDDIEHGSKSPIADRKTRIESIFLLCGNSREVAAKHHPDSRGGTKTPEGVSDKYCIEDLITPPHSPATSTPHADNSSPLNTQNSSSPWLKGSGRHCIDKDSPVIRHSLFGEAQDNKVVDTEGTTDTDSVGKPRTKPKTDVYVKWESSKAGTGKLICVISIGSSSSLADLRREIHLQLPSDFYFLILGDLGGAPVDKDTESMLLVSSLPCGNNHNSRLACLRQAGVPAPTAKVPFRTLDCNQVLQAETVGSKAAFLHQRHGQNSEA